MRDKMASLLTNLVQFADGWYSQGGFCHKWPYIILLLEKVG